MNKRVPESFPLLHCRDLALKVSHVRIPLCIAGATGAAFNISTLSQHRWNAYTDWSSSIAQTDLLKMNDKREVVESTLLAIST